jgi:hypothetical protein
MMRWKELRLMYIAIIISLLFTINATVPNSADNVNQGNRYTIAYEYDPPIVSPHPDVSFTYGQSGIVLTWNVSDENPQMYKIWINGVFVLTAPWYSNQTSIHYDVSYLPVGKHNLSLILFDASGTTSYDDVVVTVLPDTSAPVIVSPPRVKYIIGDRENYLIWEIFDHNPIYFEISLRGKIVYTQRWLDDYLTIEFNVDGLDVGGYLFKLTAYGIGGKSVGKVLVNVRPK